MIAKPSSSSSLGGCLWRIVYIAFLLRSWIDVLDMLSLLLCLYVPLLTYEMSNCGFNTVCLVIKFLNKQINNPRQAIQCEFESVGPFLPKTLLGAGWSLLLTFGGWVLGFLPT